VLGHPLLRTAGKYSYGMYLFHNLLFGPVERLVPVARLQAATGSELAGNVLFIAVFMAACFATAFVSWHAYEKHWLAFKTWFDYRPRGGLSGATAAHVERSNGV
jgi:peptidoglycan/LPS O-acetylase OafA/YrhL